MRKKEEMIFVRDKWEIASIETNQVTGKPQWIRRDSSYICEEGQEIARKALPGKPIATALSIECPHCKLGYALSVIDQHIREKH